MHFLGDGEGVGDGCGIGKPEDSHVANPGIAGLAKPSTGWFAMALAMKACQIPAGMEPPKTSANPST